MISSEEPKPLRWNSGELRQDIVAVTGRELPDVFLSDSRVGDATEKHFAYVTTPDMMNQYDYFRSKTVWVKANSTFA